VWCCIGVREKSRRSRNENEEWELKADPREREREREILDHVSAHVVGMQCNTLIQPWFFLLFILKF